MRPAATTDRIHDPGLRHRSLRGVRPGPSVRGPVGGRARGLPANERRCAAGRRGVARDGDHLHRPRDPGCGDRQARARTQAVRGEDPRQRHRVRGSDPGAVPGAGARRPRGGPRRRRTDRRRARAMLGARPGDRSPRSNRGAGCRGLGVPTEATDRGPGGGGGSARRGSRHGARQTVVDRRRGGARARRSGRRGARRARRDLRPGGARAGRGAAAPPPRRNERADRRDTWAS